MQLYEKLSKISKIPSPPIHPVEDLERKASNVESEICSYHFLHLWLTCGFYSLVIPFRPVFRFEIGHYVLYTSKFQKIACILCMWGGSLFYRLAQLRRSWQAFDKQSIIFYFQIANGHIFAFRAVLFCWVVFRKFDQFARLLEKVGHCSLLCSPSGKPTREQKWPLMIGLHITYALMALSAPILGTDSPSVLKSWDWSPEWLLRSYVARSRFTFFVDNNSSNIQFRPLLNSTSSLELALGCWEMWLKFNHDVTLSVMNLFLFNVLPLTLWLAVRNFEQLVCTLKEDRKNLKSRTTKSEIQSLIWDKYHELKYLSKEFNAIWATVVFLAILDIIPWLAVDLDFWLRANDWSDKIAKIFSLLNIAVALILAAESCRKMHWFKAWITDWNNFVVVWDDREKLEILVRELQSTPIPVGIGSPGFYQIDYALLGQLTGIVITFFVISLQSESARNA